MKKSPHPKLEIQPGIIYRDRIKAGDMMRSPVGTLYHVKGFNELGEPELIERAPPMVADGTKYSTNGPSQYLAGWTLYTLKTNGIERALERLT